LKILKSQILCNANIKYNNNNRPNLYITAVMVAEAKDKLYMQQRL